ncbi:MAG: two-component regulator propeller domain-containing protein, partial [Imperialibacter sp.]
MILLLAHIEAFSQNPLYSSYQHYGTEDGLPQNFISFIAQDSDGFIWVTTLDGLARFDGHDFLVLRKDPKESSSLSFNTIGSGFKDRYGRLWLNYANSEYDCVDPLTLRVITPKPLPAASNDLLSENTSYNAKVRANWGDVNNWLRLDTKQLHDKLVVEMFDPENTRLRSLLMNWPELGKEDIYDLAEDADGKLWILTSKYLLLSDDRGERLSRIDLPDDHQLNPSVINFWPSLAHLKDGRVVVLEGEKVVIYTPETEKWRKIQVPNSHTGKVDLADAILDPQGRFVFDYQGYIYRLESDDRLTLLWHYPEKENIRSLLIDRSNNLWVGTDSDGLYRINLLTPGFRSVTYQNGFIRDVISHELGIPLSKIGVDLKSAYSGRGYHSRYNYTSDGAMTLLMTEAGDNYYISRSIISSIKDGQINVLHTTNLLGSLVEGLKDGVGFVDQWGTHFDWSDIKQPPVSTTAEYPYFEGPKQLLFDDGRYWLATTKSGIYELEEGRIIQNIPPPESYEVNTIRLDPLQKNILWIGTMTGGLYKWDKEAGKLVAAYTMDNGLPNNTINCIIPDAQGYLWMSTNNGISRFNTVAETFSNYSTADGLIQSEFNRHHAITLPDGRMAMGGSKGYSVFHPKDFAEDTSDPAVVIARVTINNKEVDHRY